MVSITNDLDGNLKIRTCRICLDTRSVNMVLLNEDNGWLNNFEYCFGITLTIKDEPRLLCRMCAENVENYVHFKRKCENSHVLWQSVISDVKCSIVKHNTKENSNEDINNFLTQNPEIKDSTLDTSFDNALKYLNENAPNLLHTEIKLESNKEESFIHEEKLKIQSDKNDFNLMDTENVDIGHFPVLGLKDCLETNNVGLELKNSEHNDIKSKRKRVVKSHKVENVYYCKNCSKKYEFKARYLTHIKTCGLEKKKINFDHEYAYDCGRNFNCDNISKIKNEFNNGIDCIVFYESQTEGKHLCGLCKHSFSSSKRLCQHLNEHWSSNCLQCGLCDFIGIDLAAIAAHRFSHLPRSDKMRFSCHICGVTKVSLLALHFHYRSKHLKKVGGYCSRCNREFNKLMSWKKHERTHGTPRFICDFCGRKFFFKNIMRQHVMAHMRLNKCICDICGNYFARKSYLKVHVKAVHSNGGPIKCSHCDRMFKSEYSLQSHQKKIYGEKNFKCELCHKEFTMANLLQTHMVTHSNERPFCCEICGANYKAKSQLTVHMRRHTGIYPHKCTQCTKAFPSSSQLKIHISVHTGIRRHPCVVPNCVRSFHSRKLYLAHLKSHHRDENGLQK